MEDPGAVAWTYADLGPSDGRRQQLSPFLDEAQKAESGCSPGPTACVQVGEGRSPVHFSEHLEDPLVVELEELHVQQSQTAATVLALPTVARLIVRYDRFRFMFRDFSEEARAAVLRHCGDNAPAVLQCIEAVILESNAVLEPLRVQRCRRPYLSVLFLLLFFCILITPTLIAKSASQSEEQAPTALYMAGPVCAFAFGITVSVSWRRFWKREAHFLKALRAKVAACAASRAALFAQHGISLHVELERATFASLRRRGRWAVMESVAPRLVVSMDTAMRPPEVL